MKKAIESDIKKKIDIVLENEVADVAKRIVQEHIESDIYSAGFPKYYSRRYHNDGLIDTNNLVSEVNDGELRVRDVAPHTGGDIKFHDSLSHMLIDGYENRMGTEEWYNAPRPYMANSNDELENNAEVQKAIDKGLKRQGLRRIK